jgi:hypothetical protein
MKWGDLYITIAASGRPISDPSAKNLPLARKSFGPREKYGNIK